MATATGPVDTREMTGDNILAPVKGSTVIYAGTLVAADSSGRAVPAADTASLTVLGVAVETVDNSAGTDGAKSVLVKQGVFTGFANDDTNPVTAAKLGQSVFVKDDNTLAATTTNSVKAGTLLAIESDGTIRLDTRARR